MRVLGVTPTANDVSWALVEGTKSEPIIVPLNSTKQKFPARKNESTLLHDLYRFAQSLFQDKAVEKVIILQAGTSKYGKTSAIRVKTEAMFQIAGVECNIHVEVIHPNTLKAQMKKFDAEVGDCPEAVFNNGQNFKPKPWKNTILTAWMGLEE